jgi:hypothetical protein
MRQRIKILFLAANPGDRTYLKLDREFSAIQEALRPGKYRDRFQLLNPRFAARMENFTSALITHKPHIVHFCGHGSANQGIAFEGKGGNSRLAGKQELTTLFAELNRHARLVFLNACHTREQAEILGRIFDYTIGTNGLILDTDAIEFARWFYRSLADGATVRGAFLSAQSALNNRVSKTSVLSKREKADDSKSFVSQVLKGMRPPAQLSGQIFITTVEDNGKVDNINNVQVTGGQAHFNSARSRQSGRKR